MASALASKALTGALAAPKSRSGRSRSSLRVHASADRPLWAPGVAPPPYLDGSTPGDRGFDPLGFCGTEKSFNWYRNAELVHCRWSMLGVAGILGQEILRPDIFWYEAGLPKNLPIDAKQLGGLLAIEFLAFHYTEIRRWQDIHNHHSVDEDPIFKGNKVPNQVSGYPGGIFDPLGFAKDLSQAKDWQEKEIKNGRLAMAAFVGFVFAAQTTGKNPIAALQAHIADPFHNNWLTNIGHCVIPDSVDVGGVTIPLYCLWPAGFRS